MIQVNPQPHGLLHSASHHLPRGTMKMYLPLMRKETSITTGLALFSGRVWHFLEKSLHLGKKIISVCLLHQRHKNEQIKGFSPLLNNTSGDYYVKSRIVKNEIDRSICCGKESKANIAPCTNFTTTEPIPH